MLVTLSRYWWVLALRGLAAIAFGIAALVWPGLTLLTLIYLFGAYALVDGIFAVGMSIRHVFQRQTHGWMTLLEGLTSIIVGLVAFSLPGWTALALVILIAAWAIVTGVLEVAAAIRLREEIEGEWALALAGVVSVIFGLALVAYPRSGALAVIWTIGIFAILSGVSLLVLAFRLRGLHQRSTTPASRRSLAT
jgi:uncharacterized membrane protein HdeD (DUF308 family)